MVEIHSATAEIRLGIKKKKERKNKKEERKRRKKKGTRGQKIQWPALLHRAAIIKSKLYIPTILPYGGIRKKERKKERETFCGFVSGIYWRRVSTDRR